MIYDRSMDIKLEIQTSRDSVMYTDYTDYLCLPICIQDRLDESLAQGSIRLNNTPIAEAIEPMLRVRITYKQEAMSTTRQEVWLVAQDSVSRIIGNDTYIHDISLIECTKLLERIVCDTKTLTQPLVDEEGNAIVKGSIAEFIPLYEVATYDLVGNVRIEDIPYFSPMSVNANNKATITVFSPKYYFDNISGLVNIRTKVFDYDTGDIYLDLTSKGSELDEIVLATVEITGIKNIRIETNFQGTIYGQYAFDICTMAQTPNHKKYSLYDTCKIITQVAETSRIDEPLARIQLAEVSTGDEYYYTTDMANITSPEFSFGKMTLWEIFSAIGGKLNCIPLLKANDLNLGYKLYFKRLDMSTLTPLIRDSRGDSIYPLYSETKSISVEQYCDKLDSDIDNLIDTDRPRVPSIIEPAVGYLKTTRVDSGTVIVEETGVKIVTQYPIERLISVECGYLPDNTYVGDITDYVYESAEYGSLSSYTTSFPCKALALYYTYGERDIKGLTFKPEQAWANAFGLGLFNYYTILRIISLKTGKQLSALTQLFTNTYDLRFLQFRVKYIPRINARIKTAKMDYNEAERRSTITYTQGSNLVSASHYGEALKGVIERYGNVDMNTAFNLIWLRDIARVGEVYRYDTGYRVSGVNLEIYQDHIAEELQLSKHFNRYSQYVGADNYLRLFEVSEKQASERKTVYEEYLVFGYEDTPPSYISSKGSLIGITGFKVLLNGILSKGANNAKIDKIRFRGYTSEGVAVRDWITLPVVTMGVGNTMYVGMQCADNYSAGDKIVSRLSDSDYYDAQQYVPYCDYFGEIYSLEFSAEYSDKDFNPLASTFSVNWDIGNRIPDKSLNSTGVFMSTGTNKRLLLCKDSREIMELSIQVHFTKTKDSGLVLGSALADTNGLMNINTSNVGLFVLDSLLGEFTDYIDIPDTADNTFAPSDIQVGYTDNVLCWGGGSLAVSKSGIAWAMVDMNTKRLLFGKNEVVNSGDTIKLPHIWAVRSRVGV